MTSSTTIVAMDNTVKLGITLPISIMSSYSKELWCIDCNSIKVVCLHSCCPEHCDMCNRISNAYEIKLVVSHVNFLVYSNVLCTMDRIQRRKNIFFHIRQQ